MKAYRKPGPINIFLDLDGTILDVSKRYYNVHNDLMKSLKLTPMKRNEYLQSKRNKIPERDLVGSKDPRTIERYLTRRSRLIESRRYLRLDEPFSGVLKTLAKIGDENHLILVTLRKSRRNLKEQLKKLEIASFFDQIPTFRGRSCKEGGICKAKLIKNYCAQSDLPSIVVGDTEDDLEAAKSLGLKAVAVSNGLREKRLLLQQNPDYIIDNVTKLPSVITHIKKDLGLIACARYNRHSP